MTDRAGRFHWVFTSRNVLPEEDGSGNCRRTLNRLGCVPLDRKKAGQESQAGWRASTPAKGAWQRGAIRSDGHSDLGPAMVTNRGVEDPGLVPCHA